MLNSNKEFELHILHNKYRRFYTIDNWFQPFMSFKIDEMNFTFNGLQMMNEDPLFKNNILFEREGTKGCGVFFIC